MSGKPPSPPVCFVRAYAKSQQSLGVEEDVQVAVNLYEACRRLRELDAEVAERLLGCSTCAYRSASSDLRPVRRSAAR